MHAIFATIFSGSNAGQWAINISALRVRQHWRLPGYRDDDAMTLTSRMYSTVLRHASRTISRALLEIFRRTTAGRSGAK